MSSKRPKRKIGVGAGVDGLLKNTRKKRKTPQRGNGLDIETKTSYSLPKRLTKGVRQLALEREVPAKKIVREALEKFLPKKFYS